MKKKNLIIQLCFYLIFVSCSNQNQNNISSKEKLNSLKILNWNLQTFFDANTDGTEYYEFKSSSSAWNSQKYNNRLKNLHQVIKETDCDIIVMQELEKKEQLYDIYNQLCSNFNFSKNYSYGTFAKEKGSSIGIALLSRVPLEKVNVHSLDIKTHSQKQPSLRPIVCVTLTINERPLQILINHWKSKSGGAEISNFWRDEQEKLLSKLIKNAQKSNIAVLACGDFNRNLSEFNILFKNDKSHFNVELQGKDCVKVFSPWFLENNQIMEKGSYFYKDSWEKIDHFFAANGTFITDFKIENNGEWSTEDGKPFRYNIKQGTGYSDHFPISCTILW